MKNTPALFLDRDGVINKEKNYLYKIEDFEFIDGVFETCRYFQNNSYKLVIVTNQAGIARGYYNEQDFTTLNDWMLKEFKKQQIIIDAVYHCPHHPEGNLPALAIDCECRKPKPGMLLQAKSDLNICIKNSILAGDKVSDILAGKNAGIGTSILIETGHGLDASDKLMADKVVKSLKDLCK